MNVSEKLNSYVLSEGRLEFGSKLCRVKLGSLFS